MDLTGALAAPVFDPRTQVQQRQQVFQTWQVNDLWPDYAQPIQKNRGDLRPALTPNQAWPHAKAAQTTQWVYAVDANNVPSERPHAMAKTLQDGRQPMDLVLLDPEESGQRRIRSHGELVAALIGDFFSN